MSTLVIHPKDHSTDFLKPIYTTIPNKTVIDGGVNKTELREHIKNHDRVIMLGHGSPWGLLAVGQFLGADSYIIDNSYSELLSEKTDNIYIWCNADQFVERNGLVGFYSGMFISELNEATYYDFWNTEQNTIDESNDGFAQIVSKYIDHPLDVLHKNVIHQYGLLAKTNLIARFNLERLYLTEPKMYSYKLYESLY